MRKHFPGTVHKFYAHGLLATYDDGDHIKV